MAASGVQVLIFIGAWLTIVGGVLGAVALVGFYDALSRAGDWLVLAPILGVFNLTLVTASHLIPIALAYELVPDFRPTDANTFDTFTALAQVRNYTGDVILWGVVVLMYAIAIRRTGFIHSWIAWLALVVAIFAGLGEALSPVSNVIEGLTFIGFVAFFARMAAIGVTLGRGARA
jgi:hypothetical protein